MKKRILFLTGSPGIGKTTILLKVVEVLKEKGFSVGGMVSREVRSNSQRVGFEILDISSNRRGWLARVDQDRGPRVGRYRVNMENLENIGAAALLKALKDFDLVAINEIGPMELCSTQFIKAVEKTLESRRVIVGTIHWKIRDKLVEEIRVREDAEIFVVTHENRDSLHEVIARKAEEILRKSTLE